MLKRSIILGSVILTVAASPAAHGRAHAKWSRSRFTLAQGPTITSARLEGRRVVVVGEHFGAGACILIDGRRQRTEADPADPTRALSVNKSAAQVPIGEVVTVQVRNPDGTSSKEFHFFSGRVVTLKDNGKTLTVRSGERFLINLRQPPYGWSITSQDAGIIQLLRVSTEIADSQGVFRAGRRGKALLSGVGELPCHKENPPCMAATLNFEVHIVVE